MRAQAGFPANEHSSNHVKYLIKGSVCLGFTDPGNQSSSIFPIVRRFISLGEQSSSNELEMRDDFDNKWSVILARVPKGKNPFDYVQRNMSLRAHDRLTGGTFSVLIILTVFTILNILALVFCFLWVLLNGREGRSRHLWLIRQIRMKDRKLVSSPNSSLFMIMFQSLSGAATLVYFYCACKNLKIAQELNVPLSSVWFNVTFLLSFIGLWISGWGYWSASLPRQPNDPRHFDRIVSSGLFAVCGGICCSLASALYIFTSLMMQVSLNSSRKSDFGLRTQLHKHALAWAKTPKSTNPQDLASLFNQWRDNQHSFAMWRMFTGTLQGVMALLLCVWYFSAGSALQRIQHLGTVGKPHTPGAIEVTADTSKFKKLKSFNISKIELLILYCHAMVVCTLGYSVSLFVCYHLPNRLQWMLSANGNDVVLKILPLTSISFLCSIQTWKAVVRKRRTANTHTELKIPIPLQGTSDSTESKTLNTFSATNHASPSTKGGQKPIVTLDYLGPSPQIPIHFPNDQQPHPFFDIKLEKFNLES
ncbi:hypothetical protein PCANC_14150 [Puccinia coronata f. sp. avenae]|uniref:Uncharacterized protein n=1 Tax=Puccinia coronata f. sp. avenae TaxID=200324 RepID=A0A2N5SVR6_9BASI|nr:hypothetical protein PCANC_14150 [Puccinia coronata f. sp. avenae]